MEFTPIIGLDFSELADCTFLDNSRLECYKIR